MFTGLIEEIGRTAAVASFGTSRRFAIHAEKILADAKVDDSICVSGVCLTVVAVSGTTFQVQAVDETLRKTTLGNLRQGQQVNLERALRPMDRMGGHFVQGHVDGVGELLSRTPKDGGEVFRFRVPQEGAKYL